MLGRIRGLSGGGGMAGGFCCCETVRNGLVDCTRGGERGGCERGGEGGEAARAVARAEVILVDAIR